MDCSPQLAAKIIADAKHSTIELIKQHDSERKMIYNSLPPEYKKLFDRYINLDYRIFNLNMCLQEQQNYLVNDRKRKRES
jgi:hypothetical protein